MIDVENIGFHYGGVPVFHQVSFSILPGDFGAIIGSNGSGKSTLLKLLLGELRPTVGRISLFGEEVSRFSKWPLIGYVPQNSIYSAQSFPATVEEVVQANLFSQVGLMGFGKKVHREKTLHALDLVGMADYAKRLVGDLSGGQQQRVMLARVLVNDPKLLLLDEPTTGVDVQSADSLYRLLHQFNQEKGMTVLMVTHDIARRAEYVNKVFCLEEGSMVNLDMAQLQVELEHRHTHPQIDGQEGCCHGNS